MDTGSISGFNLSESYFSNRSRAGGESRGVSEGRPKSHHKSHHDGSHHHGSRAERHGKSHATNALRQEIRLALSTSFSLRFSATLPAYAANSAEQAPTDVATDTLGAARQLASADPLAASETLVSLRGRVEQAASSVRDTLGDQGREAVDETMIAVNNGLDVLDDDAARNVESAATILTAETRLRQRSSIRIRTQEGDVVRLDIRRAEQMSATDVSVTDGDTVVSATEVELSSRTRSVLRIKGDLNEAELAAIQNVFTQAQAIADEFFGGDLAAAFDMAAGFEFDAEQLSKVNMRFREKQVSTISYATLQPSPQPPVIERSSPEPFASKPVQPAAPTDKVAAATEEVAAPVPTAEAEGQAVAPTVDDNAIDGLAAMLANFLRSVNEGFESGSFRYHHSESFKLEILKSVLQVSAPEESGNFANAVAAAIDAVTVSDEDN